MTWTKNAPLQYNDLDLVPGRPKKRRKESSSAELAKTGKKVLRDSDSTRSGKSRKSAPEVAKIRPVDQTTANEQIRVRRKEGYAAAEKRMFGRCALLSSVVSFLSLPNKLLLQIKRIFEAVE